MKIDIAKGFSKRDKPLVESLWQELAESLNSAGPPKKDVTGWKKSWTEWKHEVKKKLAHNKAEGRAIGGGPFSNFHLTEDEETIVRLCSIGQSVSRPGIAPGPEEISDEVQDIGEDATSENDNLPSSSKRRSDSHQSFCTPKLPRPNSTAQRLHEFLDADNQRKIELNEKLDEIIKINRENSSSLRRLYPTIEKNGEVMCKAVNSLTEQVVGVSTRLLTTLAERNELKQKQLELEVLKFEQQNGRNN